jgi:D-alanyl-D-alanine dipeptidase
VQEYFHDVWMLARVQAIKPHLELEEQFREVERFWAAPTVSVDSPSPHSTGAAVDLTIRFVRSGEHLYMGSIFDDVTEIAYSDYFERSHLPHEVNGGEEPYSSVEARLNRRLLYWVMEEAAFANNPNEWWHFSWGDQMWAKLSDESAAKFGPAKT